MPRSSEFSLSLLTFFSNLVTVYSCMLKPEILSVLWCMSIANFIFIAVKKKRKIYEEHVQAPKAVGRMWEK